MFLFYFFCRFVFGYIFLKTLTNDEQLARVRDKEGGRGKFKLRYFETDDSKFGYPLVDDSGEYLGIIDHKGKNLFMDTIMLKYTYERA